MKSPPPSSGEGPDAKSTLAQRAMALRRHHRFAGALRNVLPDMRIIVDRRGARAARARAGSAIVLAGHGDAVAFVGARLRRGGTSLGGAGEGERGAYRSGERGGDDGSLVRHGCHPLVVALRAL